MSPCIICRNDTIMIVRNILMCVPTAAPAAPMPPQEPQEPVYAPPPQLCAVGPRGVDPPPPQPHQRGGRPPPRTGPRIWLPPDPPCIFRGGASPPPPPHLWPGGLRPPPIGARARCPCPLDTNGPGMLSSFSFSTFPFFARPWPVPARPRRV